jgi:hypothetical protein
VLVVYGEEKVNGSNAAKARRSNWVRLSAQTRVWYLTDGAVSTEERQNARVHAGSGLGGGHRVAVLGRQSG